MGPWGNVCAGYMASECTVKKSKIVHHYLVVPGLGLLRTQINLEEKKIRRGGAITKYDGSF